MSDFIQLFKHKGFLYQATDLEALSSLMKSKSIMAYLGFDCTATSLHAGHLTQLMILRLLQQTGHKPIVLVGGGTSKIGDPSFRDEARKLLTDKDIERNMDGIKHSISKFIKFGDGPTDAIMINNADWLCNLNYIDFLRDYGSLFSVNRMLSFDSVRLRLEREQNLSFLEFNYTLLQSYDFVHLYKNYGCRLQIGGSDQWGNIVSGIELQRKLGGEPIFGLTTPLLTTASGAKMGKTANGAVWLNEDLLSPYVYYQYWRNIDDADLPKFLRMFTELDEIEVAKLSALQGKELNEAKRIFAFEVTKLCHGVEAALQAEEASIQTFVYGTVSDNLPTYKIDYAHLKQGIPLFELLKQSGLAPSGGEARKLVRGGGVKVNDIIQTNELETINTSYLHENKHIKISVGKKKHMLISAHKPV
jgi:tyrosyl-tRNA synthetase